jgi:hypothetical protein
LNEIFSGNIEMPMLDEKLAVLHQVGPVLAEKYKGRFSNFIHSCPPRLYDNGKGIIDRLVVEFPRFNDVSQYDGHEIKLYKLPQLGIWFVYSSLHPAGKFQLEDIGAMTAFAAAGAIQRRKNTPPIPANSPKYRATRASQIRLSIPASAFAGIAVAVGAPIENTTDPATGWPSFEITR